MSWVDDVIADTRKKKKLAEKENPMKKTEATDSPGKKVGWFTRLTGLFGRGKKAALDAITIDDEITEADEKAEKEAAQKEITGTSVIYAVPATMKQLKVRVLESNGRLKNQYSLTRYIDIKAGDKIHIVVIEE